MTDLNSLARTLAERLMSQHPHSCHECVEAVIREAIDKTLERAREIAQMYRDSKNEYLNAEQCAELIRNRIVDEIHALKQSNSGMEVRK